MAAARVMVFLCVAQLAAASEQEARVHYTAALQHFKAGRYQAAREDFRAAHQLAPYPGLLFNIAECDDKLGETALAIADYRRYLEAAPNTTRRDQVLARIRELEAALPAPSPAAIEKPVEKIVKTPVVEKIVEKPPEKRIEKPIYKRWWPWTLAGVLAAGVIVGVSVGVTVSRAPTPDSFIPNLPTVGRGQ